MKRWSLLTCLVFVFGLSGVFVLTAYASGDKSADNNSAFCGRSPVVGCVLTSLDGVAVHYNGTDSTYAVAYEFGYMWQCVELVQRYYFTRFHYPKAWAPLYAYQMFDTWGHPSTMTAYPNGSYTVPQEGDVLVFGSTTDNPYGHVALVQAVAGGSISFVQQNVGSLAEDSLPINANNFISSRSPYGDVRGWLSDRSAHPLSAAPAALSQGLPLAAEASIMAAYSDPSIGPWIHGSLLALAIREAEGPSMPAASPSLTAIEPLPPVVPFTSAPAPAPKVGAPATTPPAVPPAPPAAPTAAPQYDLPAGQGAAVAQNGYGRGSAGFTIDGHAYSVAESGGKTVIPLAPGRYSWTFHLPGIASINGSVTIVAGQVELIQFADNIDEPMTIEELQVQREER